MGSERKDTVKMKVDQFEKRYDKKLKLHYYGWIDDPLKKSGSRKFSSQMGVIPFQENKFGCNPGQTFELYLSLLNPDIEFLFQFPKKMSKRFDISSPDTLVMYDGQSLGHNSAKRLLSNLCAAVEVEYFNSMSIRKTGVRFMEIFDVKKNKVTALVIRQPKLDEEYENEPNFE